MTSSAAESITYKAAGIDNYNALQAKFTKQFSQGLSLNLNYAYQHGLNTASNFSTWNKQAVIGNDSAIRRR